MKQFRKILTGGAWVSVLLLAFIGANVIGILKQFHGHIQNEALQTLKVDLDDLTGDIVRTTDNDWKCLRFIGNIIAKEDSPEPDQILNILRTFERNGMITDLYMLLPDNRLLSWKGGIIPNEQNLDFAEESRKERYISDVKEGFGDTKEKIVYYAEPVEKNGTPFGILYGAVRINNLKRLYDVNVFDGRAEMYLWERKNGTVLLDSWHDALENLYEVRERKPEHGYSVEKTREQLLNGESGMAVFQSKTLGEPFYFCYQPTGIRDWMVGITVPESVVFTKSKELRQMLWRFGIIEAAAVIAYFHWFLRHKREEEIEKDAQLYRVNYVYEIQKLLFDAHRKPKRMKEALCEVGKKMQAETVFFAVIRGSSLEGAYCWSETEHPDLQQSLSLFDIREKLGWEESCIIEDIQTIKETAPDFYKKLEETGIRNLMMTRVNGSDGKVVGILGVWNTKRCWKDAKYLECVALPFFMAYKNMKSQEIIGEMASVDALTGLLNRNSHELALKRYRKGERPPSACVYIDVNGLHEMNNCLGHAAGDEMLRYIGEAIQECFGTEHTYRIGGDEFLILIFDRTEEEIQEKLNVLIGKVEERSYHISTGLAYRKPDGRVDAMILAAEETMYQTKKEYYRKNKNSGKEREMNQKLERILLEKRDAEQFLHVLAPRFAGVYIVDLETERMRDIYIPIYFKELMEECEGNFEQAFQKYIDLYVREDEQYGMKEKVRREYLTAFLEEHGGLELFYGKKDGDVIKLCVYKTGEYGTDRKETVWILERSISGQRRNEVC